MDNKENIDPELFKYLSGKKFDDLSLEEKEFILKHLTEEEFKNLQETSHHINKVFDLERTRTSPGTHVKDSLLKTFSANKKAKKSAFSFAGNILNYRIPVYQPAIAFSLLLILYLSFDKPVSPSGNRYLPMDTILKNTGEPLHDMATKQILDDSMNSRQLDHGTSSGSQKIYVKKKLLPVEITVIEPVSITAVFDFKDEQVNGTTLSDDSLLASFFMSPK